MNYVTYDTSGNLTGAYQQDLQQEHIDCYIEVTDDQRANWTAYRANSAMSAVELIGVSGNGMTDEQFNAGILSQLRELDARSIRPIREGEAARVTELAAQAVALRAQLRK